MEIDDVQTYIPIILLNGASNYVFRLLSPLKPKQMFFFYPDQVDESISNIVVFCIFYSNITITHSVKQTPQTLIRRRYCGV